MPFQPNQLIGPYVLDRLLGQGTFGEVWLAHHHDLGRTVALKIPTDPKYLQQLRREGKIIYSLDHPNIVRGHDLNTLNDPPYVAMEYVEGVTLRQKIKATGKLPETEALRILRQILAALAFAHTQGVLHRDLKPENVLLTAAGVAKVADFGLGKVQAAVSQSIVFSGSLVSGEGRSVSGTVEYMSPQQKAGEEADVRDDIYAAGIMACELLTGQRPGALGIARLFQRAGVDGRFVPLLEKALDSERGERYTGAEEMLRAVDGLPAALAETRQARAAQQEQSWIQEERRRQESAEAVRREAAGSTAAEANASGSLAPIPQKGSRIVRVGLWIGVVIIVAVLLARGLFRPASMPDDVNSPDGVSVTVSGDSITLDLGNGVTMKLAKIKPGRFGMGSPADEAGRFQEERQHEVTITKGFYMGVTEVTQEQYETVMGNNSSVFRGKTNPVESVSWDDAVAFCKKLSQKTGNTVRLPTEAEWEYACRAGTNTCFGFGDQDGNLGDYAWYAGNSGIQTHIVGTKLPNAWGLYDMHGNVVEWCHDWYGDYASGTVDDPKGPASGTDRVLRGGSWGYNPRYCRSASRSRHAPDYRYYFIGFRLALDFP